MTRLLLTPQDVIGSYPDLPVTAGSADIGFVLSGASFADGFRFPMTGRELLIIRNDNAGAQTVTIASLVSKRTNRSGDIDAYSMAADDVIVLGPFSKDGWEQVSGELWGAVSAADLNLAVIKW